MDYLQQLEPLDDNNKALQANVHPLDWQNPLADAKYNLVVVGGGTAGLVAAAGAAGLGARVALVERALLGGDCLNVGCVPSKALVSAARRAAAVRDAHQLGVRCENGHASFADVMTRMRQLRASISPHDSAQRFTELGVDVFLGQGSFTSHRTLSVAGQTLTFAKAVIATGARAAVPNVPGLAETGYLTNETIFSLTELPSRLIVIGGGPIGCEMAQCFARLGSSVTLIDKGTHVLSREEADAAQIVQAAMVRDGVQLELNATPLRVERSGETQTVILAQRGEERSISG
ncbi:MAG: FAD-dependent oxidoreductase, partial [Planctomycetales bacterium]|nr:FAD-dependent oxidoreductase [Planctomycetales bacterium]